MSIGFHAQNERAVLRVSLYVAGSFVLIALGFAIATHSGAILFDGAYSMIAFLMALLTVKVANLVERPDDDRFHFGYTAIEPTLNLFKSLIIIATCLYAVGSALDSLLNGGNESEYGLATIYGIYATVGCFAVCFYMRKQGKSMRSDLVKVDAHTWLVDGILSAAILLGFVSAYYLNALGYTAIAPLVDPVLMLVLGVALLPVPVKIMLGSLNEVINKAPPEAVTSIIEKKLALSLAHVPYQHVEVRISKQGRDKYLLVHIIVDASFSVATISELDDIRIECEQKMREWDPSIVMDILFIQDPKLAD